MNHTFIDPSRGQGVARQLVERLLCMQEENLKSSPLILVSYVVNYSKKKYWLRRYQNIKSFISKNQVNSQKFKVTSIIYSYPIKHLRFTSPK